MRRVPSKRVRAPGPSRIDGYELWMSQLDWSQCSGTTERISASPSSDVSPLQCPFTMHFCIHSAWSPAHSCVVDALSLLVAFFFFFLVDRVLCMPSTSDRESLSMKVLSLLLVRAQLERADGQPYPVGPRCRVGAMTLMDDGRRTGSSPGRPTT